MKRYLVLIFLLLFLVNPCCLGVTPDLAKLKAGLTELRKSLETLKDKLKSINTSLDRLKGKLNSIQKKAQGKRRISILIDRLRELMLQGRFIGSVVTDTFSLIIHQKCSPVLTTKSIWLSFVHSKASEEKASEEPMVNIKFVDLFKKEEWLFYEVNDDFVLLIPVVYKEQVLKENWQIKNQLKDKKTQRILTNEEIILGLKFNNLKKIDDPVNYLGSRENFIYLRVSKEGRVGEEEEIKKFQKNLISSLSKIFLNREDIKSSLFEEQELFSEMYLNVWNIYLLGHGSPTDKNKLRKLSEDLKNTYDQAKSQSDLAKLFDDFIEQDTCDISGLAPSSFRILCDFFNDEIKTNLLFYMTCFGGGVHLLLPFFRKGAPKRLNYTVVCGALLSKVARGSGVYIKNVTYTGQESVNDPIVLSGGSFRFVSRQNLKRFFEELEHPTVSFIRICNYALPFLKPDNSLDLGKLVNIPQIRIPGAEWSQPINTVKFMNKVTKTIIKAKETEHKPLIFDKNRVVLLYTHNISVPVQIKDSEVHIISVLEGLDLSFGQKKLTRIINSIDKIVYFENIQTDLGFLELIIKVLTGLRIDSSFLDDKVILIRKLECRNDFNQDQTQLIFGQKPDGDKLRLKDVFLVNKTSNPVRNELDPTIKIYFKNWQNRCFEGQWNEYSNYFRFTRKIWNDRGITQQLYRTMSFDEKSKIIDEITTLRLNVIKSRIPYLTEIREKNVMEAYNRFFNDFVQMIKKYD